MTKNKLTSQEVENHLQQNTIKMQELTLRLENLDRDIDEFVTECNIAHEKLTAFIQKKENFTEENWTQLIQEKEKLDLSLQKQLSNIRNPIKTKRAYSSLHVQRHWLPVR